MNENLIDVLIYIYENYMDSENQPRDQVLLEEELASAGFGNEEIRKAFDWLDELAWRQGTLTEAVDHSQHSTRIYTREEQQRIDLDTRGLLLYLEQMGILDPASRELVIERAMALENPELDADDIKWIVLLVLLNRPGRESAFALMEEMIYNGDQALLH